MFRITLLFYLLFTITIPVRAISISGNITANSSFNGKVNVIADVFVSPGVTLAFLEGTTLILEEGVSIIAQNGGHLIFSGTSVAEIEIKPAIKGIFWGKIECEGSGSSLEMHYVNSQAGHVNIIAGASALIEDSYLRDYYNGDIPIIRTEDASDFQMRRSFVSNYYEVNIIRTLAIIEDCVFQFMTADGIDFDNSPAGTILRRSTLRFGRGLNIDAVDFGKVDFMGNGSIGLVQQCLIHDISDKGVSIGEGAQEVTVEGNLIYNCGAGVSVKDNSYGRLFNNTFVNNDIGVELVEKNPGMGGGHGYTYNNILWNNAASFFMNSTATVEIRYSDIEDMFPDPINFNISQNPQFMYAHILDFRLKESSPCISAGFNGLTLGAFFPVGAILQDESALHLGVPNSFSVYSAADTVSISWSAVSTLGNVKLSFSENNGDSWQTIASGIDALALQYIWHVPVTYSTRCKIRVEAESNPAIFSENYMPFCISPVLNDAFSPTFSLQAGYYNSEQSLNLTSEQGDIIFYTTDGSDPSDQSQVFSGTVHLGFDSIAAGQAEQNITATQKYHQPYSYIRTAPVSHIGPNPTFWYLPSGTIFKAHVIKARIYRPGEGLGPIITKSYFLDPQMLNKRYTLPIVSLVSDPGNLFDYYNGVYVPGVDFTGYSFTGNYERKGRTSEKPAHIEFFNTNGRNEFSQNVGFRVRGEWIRSTGQKALTIYARSEYDTQNEFDYKLFPGLLKPGTRIAQKKYKRFILRNAGNEWGWTVNSMCRDMLTQSLFDRLDVKYQDGNPAVVFLNGEYWGIQNIRELNDKRGLEYSYGVNPDSVIMMEDNLKGAFQLVEGNDADAQDYHNMRNFILNSDLSIQQNYSQVNEMMDIENFIDYWIATIYSNKKNTDHNTSYWKLRNGHPGPGVNEAFDGRWRWMANDFDNGFDIASHDNLSWMLYSMRDSLLKHMLTSPVFFQSFINRFADLLNSSFSTSHVLKKLDYYHHILEPEMPEHIARWRTPSTMVTWEQAMNNFFVFAQDRPAYQIDQLKLRFTLPQTFSVSLDVNDQIMGRIQLNSLRIDPSLPGVQASVYPWTGTYFVYVPVTITALPYSGYRFVEWRETGEKSSTITVSLQSDITRTAVFELDPSQSLFSSEIYPNPVAGSKIYFIKSSTVSVYDMTGKRVLQSDIPVLDFDISTLRKGIYLVRLNESEGIRLVKL